MGVSCGLCACPAPTWRPPARTRSISSTSPTHGNGTTPVPIRGCAGTSDRLVATRDVRTWRSLLSLTDAGYEKKAYMYSGAERSTVVARGNRSAGSHIFFGGPAMAIAHAHPHTPMPPTRRRSARRRARSRASPLAPSRAAPASPRRTSRGARTHNCSRRDAVAGTGQCARERRLICACFFYDKPFITA